MILKDGTDYQIPYLDIEDYQRTYPGVNIYREIQKMERWCKDNPAKRKTIKGVGRFVNSWLSRATPEPTQETIVNRMTDRSWAG